MNPREIYQFTKKFTNLEPEIFLAGWLMSQVLYAERG
jgi:hypothetical protein